MACDVPHRHATRVLAESLGKPSLWVITSAPWYKAVSHDYSGVGKDGSRWQAVLGGEVEAQERITVVSGEYDTFKVVCDNPWTKSTTHVAPRVNNVMAIIRTQKDQNQTSRWEMVRFESATPPS